MIPFDHVSSQVALQGRWSRKIFLWAIAMVLLLTWSALAQTPSASLVASDEETEEEPPTEIRLFNEHIAIIVNATESNTGRFAVETTGGDPDRTSDDNSPLIYKMPGQSPWTSYTTLRIDGIDYVFGGEPTERAGRAGLFGERVSGPEILEGNVIETVYKIGPILATQTLSIIRSSTTGLLDTARIGYKLQHVGNEPIDLGVRVMLDTMLGQNDGAPFRVEELAITSDTVFEGEQIPEFWQAFDSLADPRVTSQGTLRGRDVTTPDRVFFSNWGALADGLWDFRFEPGRDFTRLGEFELDSATAMYWDPERFMPGDLREYVVHYGLGDISISPGQLSLGVTSPATVTAETEEEVTFPVVAYIQNTGEGEARDVVATLSLPTGLKPAAGEILRRPLGTLPSGRTAQVTWRVALDRAVGGEMAYSVRVEAINAEANEVERRIRIVSPAHLSIELEPSQGILQGLDGTLQPLPFKVTAFIQNIGGSDADNTVVHWESPLGLQLAEGDRADKPIGPLAPGEKVTVTWHIRPRNVSATQPYPFVGNLTYSVKGTISGRDETYRANGFLDVPPLNPAINLVPATDDTIRVGNYVSVHIQVQNISRFYGGDITVMYDPRVLHLVGGPLGAQRGRLFIELEESSDPAYLVWEEPVHTMGPDQRSAEIRMAGQRRGANNPTVFWANDTFATLRFRVLQPGDHPVAIVPQKTRLFDRDNQGIRIQDMTNAIIRAREQ